MKKYDFYNEHLSFAELASKATDYQANLLGAGSRYKDIFELIPAGGTVLDYGCGFGLFTSLVAKKSLSISGIDKSSNEISIAKKLFAAQRNLKFSNQDITTLKAKKRLSAIQST